MRVLATSYHRRPKPKRGKTGVVVLPVSQWEIYVIQGKKQGPLPRRRKLEKKEIATKGIETMVPNLRFVWPILRRVRGGRL